MYATATYVNYGCALMELDRLEQAAEALVTAERLTVEAGDTLNACIAHHNLAEIALLTGDVAAALGHAQREHSLAIQIGDPLRQAIALDMVASATVGDDREAAKGLWSRALQTYREVGHQLAVSSSVSQSRPIPTPRR